MLCVCLFFSVDLQTGAWANIAYMKSNSLFGVISAVISISVIVIYLGLAGLTAKKVWLLMKSNPTSWETANSAKDNSGEKKWRFLLANLKPNLPLYATLIQQIRILKETTFIFFVVTFSSKPLLQLVPALVLSVAMAIVIIIGRPFKNAALTVLYFGVEVLYSTIFALMIFLHSGKSSISDEEGPRRRVASTVIILALIIVVIAAALCLIDLAWIFCKILRRKQTHRDAKLDSEKIKKNEKLQWESCNIGSDDCSENKGNVRTNATQVI